MAARLAAYSGRICSAGGAIIRIDNWHLGDIGWKTMYIIICVLAPVNMHHLLSFLPHKTDWWKLTERVTPDRNLDRYHWRRNGSDQGDTTDFWPRSFHATPIGLMFNSHIEGGSVPWCPPPPPFRRLCSMQDTVRWFCHTNNNRRYGVWM